MPRLSQADILEATQDLLRKRGELPTTYVAFKYKFGIVGTPTMTLVGDAIDLPNAGQIYLDWDFRTVHGGGIG